MFDILTPLSIRRSSPGCITIKSKMPCGMPLCLSVPGDFVHILVSLLFLTVTIAIIGALACTFVILTS